MSVFYKISNNIKKEFNNINDFPMECFGFVYCITDLTTGRFYVGKKFLFHNKTKKLGKKAIAGQTGRGRKATKEIITSESDWKTYWSSSKELQRLVEEKGENNFSREILAFGYSKKHLTYLEIKYQMLLNVLEDSKSFNDNISGHFYKKDLDIIDKA